MPEWPPAIHQAVVVRQPLEGIWVHQLRGGKPAAEDMDVGRGALVHARVHYLHNELGDAGGPVWALEDADVLVCAHICSKTSNQLPTWRLKGSWVSNDSSLLLGYELRNQYKMASKSTSAHILIIFGARMNIEVKLLVLILMII